MTIQIEIPEPLAGKLTSAAKSQGVSPEEIALEAISSRIDPLARLDELLAPTYQAMKELGETEDNAVEYFEEIKHQLRREQRAANQ